MVGISFLFSILKTRVCGNIPKTQELSVSTGNGDHDMPNYSIEIISEQSCFNSFIGLKGVKSNLDVIYVHNLRLCKY